VPEDVDQHQAQFDRCEECRTDDDLFPDKERFHLSTSSATKRGKVRACQEGGAKSRAARRLAPWARADTRPRDQNQYTLISISS
jgi:hypothetical protein